MKKTLISTLGLVAILSNLLLPSLAFGQETQVGQLDVECGGTVSFSADTDLTAITYLIGGTGGTNPQTSFSAQETTSDDDGAVTAGRFVGVTDPRNDDGAGTPCNSGFTLTVYAEEYDVNLNGTYGDDDDLDDLVFENGVTTDEGVVENGAISLANVSLATTTYDCPAGWTRNSNSVSDYLCFEDTAQCSDNGVSGNEICKDMTAGTVNGFAQYDMASDTTFSDLSTIESFGAALGTGYEVADTSTLTIMSFAAGAELFGEAGVNTVSSVELLPNKDAGTYQTLYIYTAATTPL